MPKILLRCIQGQLLPTVARLIGRLGRPSTAILAQTTTIKTEELKWIEGEAGLAAFRYRDDASEQTDVAPELEAAEREREALEDESELVNALARAGAEAARRSLRLRPRNLEHDLQADVLTLAFDLPPGAYATSLLRELVSTKDATISRPL